MLKTCLFDLGNVLLRFSHQRMCLQMGRLCDRSEDEVYQEFVATRRHLTFERGEQTEPEFHAWFEQFAQRTVAWDPLRRAVADIFEPIPGMEEILDSVRSQGIRLVLLSNTNSAHIGFIRDNFDVLGRFDHLVLSFEVGALKPEAAIFEAALKQIQCEPAECFYTDDIPEYVEQGRKHGLQAEVFETPATLREQLERRGLRV